MMRLPGALLAMVAASAPKAYDRADEALTLFAGSIGWAWPYGSLTVRTGAANAHAPVPEAAQAPAAWFRDVARLVGAKGVACFERDGRRIRASRTGAKLSGKGALAHANDATPARFHDARRAYYRRAAVTAWHEADASAFAAGGPALLCAAGTAVDEDRPVGSVLFRDGAMYATDGHKLVRGEGDVFASPTLMLASDVKLLAKIVRVTQPAFMHTGRIDADGGAWLVVDGIGPTCSWTFAAREHRDGAAAFPHVDDVLARSMGGRIALDAEDLRALVHVFSGGVIAFWPDGGMLAYDAEHPERGLGTTLTRVPDREHVVALSGALLKGLYKAKALPVTGTVTLEHGVAGEGEHTALMQCRIGGHDVMPMRTYVLSGAEKKAVAEGTQADTPARLPDHVATDLTLALAS